ncbi:MAG: dTMP kinase [Candidatus Aenigmatarchaeota archaeon]
MKGIFIAFEGITGSGKKTHIKMITEELLVRKIPFTTLSFPDFDNDIARLTKRLQLDAFTLSLLYAADRSFSQDRIKALLEAGQIVITDRYCYSNFAYQAAKGVPLEWLKEIEKHLIKPDIVFLIDVPVETTLSRVRQLSLEDFSKKEILERIEKEKEILERTRENFLKLAKENREAKWYIIDATKSIQEVHQEIWSILEPELERLKSE